MVRTLSFLFLTGIFAVAPLSTAAQQDSFKVTPYLQHGTQTSMVVLWETHEDASSRVEYGRSRLGAESPDLSSMEEAEGQRTMHEVVLKKLEPETKYFWRVVSVFSNGRRLVSDFSSFRTAVRDSSAFAFLLYGDTQDNPEVWGRLAKLGWSERPNFGLIAGDLVGRGGDLDDWLLDFFPPAKVLMERVPLFTVIGNHEDDHPLYYQYMHNPPPEYRYTFRYGNAQFFLVDTNRDVSEGSEQYEWLEWELARSDAVWKFVMHHHPPYSSEENDHGDSWVGSTIYGTSARNLVPLYERYGVDFCLFGHVHMYERTWPIFEGAVNQQDGVIYINSGGGGGGLEDFAPTRSWFSAKVRSTHHYTYFIIHDETLEFQAIDQEGRLFDQFSLRKDISLTAAAKTRVTVPPAPRVEPDGLMFLDKTTVTLTSLFEDMVIHFTLDGSEPSPDSPRYVDPIPITSSVRLKAIVVDGNGTVSRVKLADFTKGTLVKSLPDPAKRPGLKYSYYEGQWKMLPDFSRLNARDTGVTAHFDLTAIPKVEDGYGIVFEGLVQAPKDGVYTFETASDDGTQLYLGDHLVVNNDGSHSVVTRRGQIALEAGWHPFRLEYFEDHGGESLSVSWAVPGMELQHMRPEVFGH